MQPEVCLRSRRNVLNCCLNSAEFLQIREIFLTVPNYFGHGFLFQNSKLMKKRETANLFEISGYLCLLSIREITSSIYATTAKELSL